MKATMEEYRSIRDKLKKQSEKLTYFNRKTLDIILTDREKAAKIFANGGDVQEFYSSSETLKTDFYNKNGGAYCVLLEILADSKWKI